MVFLLYESYGGVWGRKAQVSNFRPVEQPTNNEVEIVRLY